MSTLGLLLFTLLAYAGQVYSILIPGPDEGHKYKSAVASFILTDMARKDPFDGSDRKVMVSLFMPIPKASCDSECEQPYMGEESAMIANEQFFGDKNNGVFEAMGFEACCVTSGTIDASKLPVVVLEPHTDASRLLYTNLARYMASRNFAVVLLDHLHDSAVTEIPGSPTIFNSGATALSNLSPLTAWNDTVKNALRIRTEDIKSALSKLSDPSILLTNFVHTKFSGALDTSSYSIVGHGLGGTVATYLAFTDPTAKFSINLSGSAPPLNHSVNKPTYFIGRGNFKRQHDINWPATWKYLTGPATEYDLNDSEIFDFSDVPVIVEAIRRHGLHAKGVGNQGAWGNHAVKCFVEGIVMNEMKYDQGETLSSCMRIFGENHRMVPYMASSSGMMQHVTQKSAALSMRRGILGKVVTRWVGNWWYM